MSKAFCPTGPGGGVDPSCAPPGAAGRQEANLGKANDAINQIKTSGATPERVRDLAKSLSKLTVPQLRGLKEQHGLNATPRLKADLVKALSEHLSSKPLGKLPGAPVEGKTIAERLANYKECDHAISVLAARHEEHEKLNNDLETANAERRAVYTRGGAAAEYDKALAKQRELSSKVIAHTEETRSLARQLLQVEGAQKFNLVNGKNQPTPLKAAKEANDFLGRLVKLNPPEERLRTTEIKLAGRSRTAYQHAPESLAIIGRIPTVRVGSTRDPGAIAHELAHAVELSAPKVYDAAKEFSEHRFGAEPFRPLRDVFPGLGYGYNETGRKDDFEKLFGSSAWYVGKQYAPYQATEVVSMGAEALWKDPAKMAAVDPEYFKFIVGTLSGSIRGRSSS
jgi:hypothetical protein